MPITYQIRRVSPLSAFKFGCLVGGVIMLPLGLVGGFLSWVVVGALRGWLETWQGLDLTLIQLNPLEFLRLVDFLTTLQAIDALGWLFVLGVVLALGIGGGIALGFLSALGALVYNIVAALSGGLSMTLDRR